MASATALALTGWLLASPGLARAESEGFLDATFTPFQLAISPPSVQLFTRTTPVYGVRLNLLYGNQSELYGLDLGLFGDAYTLGGIQLGLGNQVFGALHGVQLGLANSSEKGAGLQIGLLNRTHHMRGLQIGLINWNDEGLLPVLPFFNFHF